jgi:predicted RNA binding protein YcfA (HicA-like mRNA interferase family)
MFRLERPASNQMTVLKTRDVVNSLSKKGFRSHDGAHKFLVFWANDKKTSIHTMVSHGGREIDDHLIGLMSSQIRLDKEEFVKLVECMISKEDYLQKMLRDRAVVI